MISPWSSVVTRGVRIEWPRICIFQLEFTTRNLQFLCQLKTLGYGVAHSIGDEASIKEKQMNATEKQLTVESYS